MNDRTHLHHLTEWHPNPILEMSASGEILYANLVARAQFSNPEKIGFNHPILQGLIEQFEMFAKIQGEFIVFSREIKYLNNTYEQHIFSLSGTNSFFIYMDDVTKRKLAETRLSQKNSELTETMNFLNNILDSSIEYAIIAIDLEGKILTWNAGAKANYGFEKYDVVGKKSVFDLYLPEIVQSGSMQRFMDSVLDRGIDNGEFESIGKNGEHFIASIVMSVRLDAKNKAIGYLLIARDVTERKYLEEQFKMKQQIEDQTKLAQEASRLKSEFLTNMSHELRTPLNAVIGFSELMHSEGLGPINTEQKEAVKDILQSAKDLLRMLDDLFDMTKLKFASIEFYPETIDLRKLVDEVKQSFYALSVKKRLSLIVTIDAELTTVYLDPTRLKQVLYNYLSNAVKFVPERGAVQLRIVPESVNDFRIEVEDNGKGIKPEDMNKLFVTLQSLDSSVTKHYAGIGLGLALTKHIVEAQGGSVGAICTAEKNIFYAILPQYYPSGREVSN